MPVAVALVTVITFSTLLVSVTAAMVRTMPAVESPATVALARPAQATAATASLERKGAFMRVNCPDDPEFTADIVVDSVQALDTLTEGQCILQPLEWETSSAWELVESGQHGPGVFIAQAQLIQPVATSTSVSGTGTTVPVPLQCASRSTPESGTVSFQSAKVYRDNRLPTCLIRARFS